MKTFKEYAKEDTSIVESNDITLQPGKATRASQLKAGNKYFAHYSNGWNYFTELFEFVKFVVPKDGVSPHDKNVEFDEYFSIKELKKGTGAKNMGALKELDVRMYCRWPSDNQEGPYYYICDKKWVRGSGCDKLAFSEAVVPLKENFDLNEDAQGQKVVKEFWDKSAEVIKLIEDKKQFTNTLGNIDDIISTTNLTGE
jgi:hypothetical protein